VTESTLTLTETLASLGLTPKQIAELEEDDERAWGWILWLREQAGITNPAGLLIAKYRTGSTAPDAQAWRGNTPGRGPDYPTLLRCAQALVTNTGHEYREEELLEELRRLEHTTQIGNGATLTGKDRDRLLREAAKMRENHELGQEQRDQDAQHETLRYYTDQIRQGKINRRNLRGILPQLQHILTVDQAEALRALTAEGTTRA